MPRPIPIAALAAFLLAGCGRTDVGTPAGAGPPLTKVILQADWLAEPEQGGFYEALAKGYYREEGLDVEIRQGGPSAHPAAMVATGRADFGMDTSDDVILAANRGVPLVMIGAFMQRNPQAIMFHRESGIRSFRDLDGRTVMAVPSLPFIAVLEDTFHIRILVTPSDFGMSRFLADRNFVQQCFVTDEPYYVRKQGADVGVLMISDTGYSPYSVWYSTRGFLAAHAGIARAFSRATVRGWRDFLRGDRAPAERLIASLNPRMDPEFMAYAARAMQDYRLVTGDSPTDDIIGRISRERIATEISQLREIGLVDKPLAVDDVLDSRFQP
jgi:NitT/TauT family transport system substrate-binding protein